MYKVQLYKEPDMRTTNKPIQAAEIRNNNFDFLRLLAAFMVLYSHQYPLLGRESPYIPRLADNWGLSFGSLGVAIFFTISGYLVTQSWIHDPHIGRYLAKRLLRVWPGLAVVTLIAAFVVGPMVSSLTPHDYFHDSRTWNYLRALHLKIIFSLPGVFEENPFPNAVNGSLWTIRIEFRWYLYLLAFGMATYIIRPKWRRIIFLVSITVGFFYYFSFHHPQTRPDRSWGLDYGMYFCFGALMYLCRDKWKSSYWLLAMAAGGGGILSGANNHGGTSDNFPNCDCFRESFNTHHQRLWTVW